MDQTEEEPPRLKAIEHVDLDPPVKIEPVEDETCETSSATGSEFVGAVDENFIPVSHVKVEVEGEEAGASSLNVMEELVIKEEEISVPPPPSEISEGSSSEEDADYTWSEYTDMIMVLGKCKGNAKTASQYYRERFPSRHAPSARTISGVFEELKKTGNLPDMGSRRKRRK